jgi:hypothetical protein
VDKTARPRALGHQPFQLNGAVRPLRLRFSQRFFHLFVPGNFGLQFRIQFLRGIGEFMLAHAGARQLLVHCRCSLLQTNALL